MVQVTNMIWSLVQMDYIRKCAKRSFLKRQNLNMLAMAYCAVLPRLPEVNNTMMWVGHNLKAGLNPMCKDQMYMFVTQDNAPGT